MPPERLITVGTAARFLQVSAQTIRNWIKAEKLEAFRAENGQCRVSAQDVAALREILQNKHA